MKALKVLYFVNGPAPSALQNEEAHAMNANVCFRNARAIASDAPLEECDGVAGEVPPVYSAKFPDAASAIEARAKKLAALSAKVGDEPAPKKTDAAPAKPAEPTAKAPAKPAAPATPATPAPAAPVAPAGAAPGWKPNA